MKIETYEIEHVKSDNTIEQAVADGEYLNLVDELGLIGQQQQFINKKDGTGEPVIFPYPRMTQLEQRVFEIHCPHRTDLKDYKSEMIPVRVLQVAQHALSTGFTRTLKIWHPEDAKLDPILVAYSGKYDNDLWLLARWGAVFKDFKTLLTEAKAEWSRVRKAKLARALREVQALINNLECDAEEHFSMAGGHVPTSIYF